MGQDLREKVAVVTGATRGIGRAIAEALLDAGASVAICSRNEADVQRAVEDMGSKGRVVGRACNVGRLEEVEGFFAFVEESFGRLDFLINNAGVGGFAPIAEMNPELWREIIDTNLSGPFYCSREAIPLMKKGGGGFIINIGSLAGRNAFPGGSAYNASKFGLVGFTEAIMQDLRYDNIRVSSVMPGSVQTEFGRHATAGTEWKIAPEHLAETVLHLLRMPARSLASRVEVRPSRQGVSSGCLTWPRRSEGLVGNSSRAPVRGRSNALFPRSFPNKADAPMSELSHSRPSSIITSSP